MEPMRPVDVRDVPGPRTPAESRVQQVVLLLCAIPFVVLVIVGAPLWGWAVVLVSGLVIVSATEYVIRRRNRTRIS